MNYDLIYDNLIARAKNKTLEVFTEEHHIVPSCMGGKNYKNNLVNLTPREHYLAHLLLVKMNKYKNHENYRGLIFAAHMMSVDQTGKKIRNNKEYEWLKKLHSEFKSGENHYAYGKTLEEIHGFKRAKQIKRKMSVGMSIHKVGKNNPKYDHKIYGWFNPLIGFVLCTRHDLVKLYPGKNFKSERLKSLITKKRPTHKNWSIINLSECNSLNLKE